jgi:hypothetical protein
MSDVRNITIRSLPDGREQSFNGRFAWALAALIAAGDKGATPIDHPGPRWSHYVHVLRREGLAIETVDERHGPPFPGRHARYVLRSAVEVVSIAIPGNPR